MSDPRSAILLTSFCAFSHVQYTLANPVSNNPNLFYTPKLYVLSYTTYSGFSERSLPIILIFSQISFSKMSSTVKKSYHYHKNPILKGRRQKTPCKAEFSVTTSITGSCVVGNVC